jgi:hypothetical protein
MDCPQTGASSPGQNSTYTRVRNTGASSVGFDSTDEFFVQPIDVEYRSLRPRRHIDSYLTGKHVSLTDLCAKSNQWAYEREVRAIPNLLDCERRGSDSRGFPVFVQPLPPYLHFSISRIESCREQLPRQEVSRFCTVERHFGISAERKCFLLPLVAVFVAPMFPSAGREVHVKAATREYLPWTASWFVTPNLWSRRFVCPRVLAH